MICLNDHPVLARVFVIAFVLIHLASSIPAQNVFVSSRNGHAVKLYDLATGNYIKDFVPAGSGGLLFPQELLWHPDGYLLVVGRGNSAIKKYDGETGAYLGNFTTGYALDNPTKTTIWKDSLIYVSQWGVSQNKIARFNLKTGVFVDEFTKMGIANGDGHDWDAFDNLYVAQFFDGQNGRVMKFDTDGNFIGIFVSSTILQGPVNLWFNDDKSSLFVVDWTLGQVLKFNGISGAFQSILISGLANTEGFTFDNQGNLYVCDWSDNIVYRYSFVTNTLTPFIQTGGLLAPNSILIREAVISSANQVDWSDKIAIQVLPNPAQERLEISYELLEKTSVAIQLLDMQGKVITQLAAITQPAGKHQQTLSIPDLPAGVYLCRLQLGIGIATKKVMIGA